VPQSRPDRILFYLHGGSFTFRFPNAHAAFAAQLCRRLRARALIPDYRLAPAHPYPAAPDDCHVTYRWALKHAGAARDIVFLGDSAGGNLVLVTIARALRAGEALPACAVLLSPAVDATLANRSIVDNASFDPLLSLHNLLVLRRGYVVSPKLYAHADVSPLFADFSGYPPLYLQAGSTELLRDEAVRTAEMVHAAGVDAELELWLETPHLFQMAPFLPETMQALDRTVRFIAARTGWVPTASSPDAVPTLPSSKLQGPSGPDVSQGASALRTPLQRRPLQSRRTRRPWARLPGRSIAGSLPLLALAQCTTASSPCFSRTFAMPGCVSFGTITRILFAGSSMKMFSVGMPLARNSSRTLRA
jgi:epsilon-lactone hydrolase